MATTFREYMSIRRAEIQQLIKELRAELNEIDAASAALDGEPAQRSQKERGTPGSGKKTLKELAIEALNENHNGLEASEILKWIKDKYGLEVARESMSPQLSRLGHDLIIKREGLVWRLMEPTVATPDVSRVQQAMSEIKTAPTSEEEGAE